LKHLEIGYGREREVQEARQGNEAAGDSVPPVASLLPHFVIAVPLA
jgi:hypothetical protein